MSASGLTDAVQSLSSGGAPPRWVVIDDGWQCTDVDAPYRTTPTEKLRDIASTEPMELVRVFERVCWLCVSVVWVYSCGTLPPPSQWSWCMCLSVCVGCACVGWVRTMPTEKLRDIASTEPMELVRVFERVCVVCLCGLGVRPAPACPTLTHALTPHTVSTAAAPARLGIS